MKLYITRVGHLCAEQHITGVFADRKRAELFVNHGEPWDQWREAAKRGRSEVLHSLDWSVVEIEFDEAIAQHLANFM